MVQHTVSAEAIAIVGAAVGLLGVLVPMLLMLGRRIDARMDALAADLSATRTELRADVAEVRRDLITRTDRLTDDLHALAERVARMEGALAVPWRPANGTPAPAPVTPPETAP